MRTQDLSVVISLIHSHTFSFLRTSPSTFTFIHPHSVNRQPNHKHKQNSYSIEKSIHYNPANYSFLQKKHGIHLTALANCSQARHVPGFFETNIASSSVMFRNPGTTFSTHRNFASSSNGEIKADEFRLHSLFYVFGHRDVGQLLPVARRKKETLFD